MTSELLTTIEAAQYVRLAKPTLVCFRVKGSGPPYCKLGGAVRYRRVDLDAWLESRLQSSTSANT
jgi:predicted DNA-binding transcriptional regulator AlpA